jgi:L-2,4-diaminobutyrate decarboxylase
MYLDQIEIQDPLCDFPSTRSLSDLMETLMEDQQDIPQEKVLYLLEETDQKALSHGFAAKPRALEAVIQESRDFIFKNRVRNNHPLWMGFIPGPASPLSWIADIMASAYNVHAGSWIQSSGISYIEKNLIRWLASRVGYELESAGGLFVSGGSMANLTGLVIARDRYLKADSRSSGVAYLAEQTHSSVAKALQIIGFVPHQIKKIKVNESFQIDQHELVKQINLDLAVGLKPFLVVGTAGTTNTGAVDDFRGLAQICTNYNLYFHIDGAYGASILLSETYNKLFDGIHMADSISWDPHKWLFQTYGCSLLLVKNKDWLPESFSTRPEYLKDAVVADDQINYWEQGPELTRPARAFKLWFTLQVAGLDRIHEAIDHGIRMSQFIEKELRSYAHWQIVTPSQLGILTFRYFDPTCTESQLHEFNKILSEHIIHHGDIGILSTRLAGKLVLRICTIHPQSKMEQMRAMIITLNHYIHTILDFHINLRNQ